MAISSSRYVNINSVLVPSALSAASSGGGGVDPEDNWILAAGAWNDNGVWKDSEIWNDEA